MSSGGYSYGQFKMLLLLGCLLGLLPDVTTQCWGSWMRYFRGTSLRHGCCCTTLLPGRSCGRGVGWAGLGRSILWQSLSALRSENKTCTDGSCSVLPLSEGQASLWAALWLQWRGVGLRTGAGLAAWLREDGPCCLLRSSLQGILPRYGLLSQVLGCSTHVSWCLRGPSTYMLCTVWFFSSFSSFLQPALYFKPQHFDPWKAAASVHVNYIGIMQAGIQVCVKQHLFSSTYLNLILDLTAALPIIFCTLLCTSCRLWGLRGLNLKLCTLGEQSWQWWRKSWSQHPKTLALLSAEWGGVGF